MADKNKSNPQGKDAGQLLRNLLSPAGEFQQLNPLQDNVLKSVQKVHKKQVEEAMQQGASGEQVLRDAGVSIAPQQPTEEEGKQAISTLVGQQPPELQQPRILQPQGLFTSQRLTPEGDIQLGGKLAMGGMSLEQIQLLQQIIGQQPIQPLDAAKLQTSLLNQANQLDRQGALKPNDLFQGYYKASRVFMDTRDSHARVEAAATNPSPAGDLALIFNFMKVLDPGSVVRESEFANAQTAQSWIEAHGVSWKKVGRVWRGERLSDEARRDFVNRARRLFQAAQRQQSKTYRGFAELARKNNLDPSRLFYDVGMALGQATPGDKETTGQTTSGNIFRRK